MSATFGIIGDYDETQARAALAKLSPCKDATIILQERLFFLKNRSSAQRQNRHSTSKILLSVDGNIYNLKQLKRDLALEHECEQQILSRAYLKWGVDFINRLHGAFNIALLDGAKLYLFRDRLGKKPLFYLQNKKSFIYASQMKAVVPFLQKKEMDEDALMSYLTFLAPTPPFTFFKGLKKLAAGEYLLYENEMLEVKCHYNLLQTPPRLIQDEAEALFKLESLLQESISQHLNSDAPTVALLSGGIDSATINYYAKKESRNIPTYTLGYEEFSKYDERENANATARFLGIENSAVEMNEQSFISTMHRVLNGVDEPLNDPAEIPLYYLFEKIKKDGYTLVLSGEGSDELFLGYRQYFEYLDIEKASQLLHKNWLKKYFHANFSMNREWEWYKRIFDETLLFRSSADKFTDLQKNALMRRNVRDNDSLKYIAPFREKFECSAHSDASMWYSYIDLQLFQAEHFLSKLERTAQAHSIETRTPFLDHKLVETIFMLEPKLRYEDGVTKSLLKKIMQDKLDTSILIRKKKGFANPYMEYLIRSNEIALIEEVNAQTGLFKPQKLQQYIESASKGSFKQHIWGLYVLSHWIKREFL